MQYFKAKTTLEGAVLECASLRIYSLLEIDFHHSTPLSSHQLDSRLSHLPPFRPHHNLAEPSTTQLYNSLEIKRFSDCLLSVSTEVWHFYIHALYSFMMSIVTPLLSHHFPCATIRCNEKYFGSLLTEPFLTFILNWERFFFYKLQFLMLLVWSWRIKAAYKCQI